MTLGKPGSLDAAARRCGELWEAAYDSGIARTYTATHRSIKEAMLDNLTGDKAEKPFIYFRDQVVTRGQADKAACRLAHGLLHAGVKKGDRVSIVVSNCPEIVVSFMACYKAGFIAAGYNQRCTSREIVGAVSSVDATALIVEKETLPKVFSAVCEGLLPALKVIVVVEGDSAWGDFSGALLDEPVQGELSGIVSGCSASLPVQVGFASLLAASNSAEPDVCVNPDDEAILLFTGGTTGVSKGCCQTHERMVFELEAMGYWVSPALKTDSPSFLVCMPMTHIMGINYGIHWQLINGGSVVIAAGNKPPDIKEALDRYTPDVWATLPTLLHSVSCDEGLPQTHYKHLDLVIFGGSFISKEMLESLAAKTNARFVESYGMSESFGFVTCNPVGSMGKVGSIGIPLCNTDVLVVDAQEGSRVLERGEKGEIIFRGPQIIRGYWNNPEETTIALREGWLYSGDIGYMDTDGFFYLVDRKKDTIVVSGFNVFPKEIDETLLSYPDVLDACTIGVPDEHSGERPKSFVVTKDDRPLEVEKLLMYCRERLVAYKVPKYIEAVAEIPKTKARKPDRVLLRHREVEKSKEKNV